MLLQLSRLGEIMHRIVLVLSLKRASGFEGEDEEEDKLTN